ncbi:MAG: hypothetical protein WKF41_13795 [Gaiellaceae bacterium]
MLRLEERHQRKVAYANAATGMGEVLPGQLANPRMIGACEIVRSVNSTSERINELAVFVAEAGLEPPEPAEPLPVIQRDDVRLICWMTVTPTP